MHVSQDQALAMCPVIFLVSHDVLYAWLKGVHEKHVNECASRTLSAQHRHATLHTGSAFALYHLH